MKPDRNLALELVRLTEAAALASAHFMGKGDKEGADQASVSAMRKMFDTIDIAGTVVIGEGEKDEAPMLYIGEKVGSGRGPKVDVAVDPIDGTRSLSEGGPGAISTVALAEGGMFFKCGPIVYMDKIAVGPQAAGVIDLDLGPTENLKRVTQAKGKDITDLTVVILDRPRHKDLIEEIRKAGARIRLIRDGDVAAALMTSFDETGIDLLLGVGGAPEAVLAAAALRCLGGEIQAKIWPRSEEERRAALEYGLDPQKILTTADLARGEELFFAATGVTNGELLRGVRRAQGKIFTHSLVTRSQSGTVRYIEAVHSLARLKEIGAEF